MTAQMKARQQLMYSGRGRLKLVCGVRIWQVPNGDLLSTWLSGGDKESAADNCGVMSRSSDRGRTWSEPQALTARDGDNIQRLTLP